jgi:hypothetical protein
VFKWLAAAAALTVAAFPLALLFLVSAAAEPSQGSTSTPGGPSVEALSDIPPAYLAWYLAAAGTCSGLPWDVLAGIGKVESDHGRSAAPGVRSGANSAGAEGPMQFEPATFARYAVNADHASELSPYNPADAIYTAAAMLCADGAASGTADGIRQAVFAYCADVLVMPIWGGKPWWLPGPGAGEGGITRGRAGASERAPCCGDRRGWDSAASCGGRRGGRRLAAGRRGRHPVCDGHGGDPGGDAPPV